MQELLQRPAPGDAAPYYFRYIDLVPQGDVLGLLAGGVAELRNATRKLGPDRETWRYAPGKWSVRDLVGHVLDSERVFGHRAFHIARGDAAPQPSMEQDDYVATAGADRRPLAELLDEFDHLRKSHLAMFAGFDKAAWERVGIAAENPVRVRALPFILAGHEIHHRGVLLERYLDKNGDRR